MKQSKFSLADVLTVLAAFAFSFICFLGTNFYTLGNTKQSIILAVIIGILLGGTALGAKLLKRTNGNFKTCFIWEIVFLGVFTLLMVFFSYSPFPHYFVVSEKKADIRQKLNTSIEQAGNMFTAYESYAENREKLYKSKLNSVVAAKNINPGEYEAYGFENNGIQDRKQIENKMFIVHADLFPTNYSDSVSNRGIKEVALNWLSDAQTKISAWKPIGIVDVVNEVEENSNNWLNQLVSLSSVREKGEQTSDFDYHLTFSDVKRDFTTPGNPTPFSIGLAVAAYLLMLLSYLISKRSTKTTIGTTKEKGRFDIEY